MPILFVIALFLFVFFFIKNRSGFSTCKKCEGKGYWRGLRGEKTICDICKGEGHIPKK